ncbi:LuxR C-terminal-related transcriptional regulator [Sphingomonas flavalba]|uniref:LuxR C-terminal-related transcriptional regulator n=1 Tax=Sphingomonas flavalba TaxID=2559804 RepID=UPI00109D9580|nr:LuxR C-terminal-related transcriptional regulator [Sphingomonas flavalba]
MKKAETRAIGPDAAPPSAPPTMLIGKMRPPRQRIVASVREALLGQLETSLSALITIAQSPAGFGKTTLLGQWFERLRARGGIKVAWLSLDEDDGEITRFLANLALAFQAAGIAVDPAATSQAPSFSEAAYRRDALRDAIEREPATVIVILDDYHRVRSAEVDSAINYLVRAVPTGLHVVISTRDWPDLRVADLEAQGLVATVDAAMLALTVAEAATIFEGRLEGEDLARIHARTEGWAVALQLAKLWIDRDPARRGEIGAFSGHTDAIGRYLLEQVLGDLEPDLQDFLVETSILDSFDAEAADAVRDRDDSRQALTRLGRFDALLIPLDAGRRWFRYHHLFADFLREQLQRDPARATRLHRRAATRFAADGDVLQAVKHAQRAGDLAGAVALVNQAGGWEIVLHQGVGFARGLMALFDPAAIECEPALLRVHGYLRLKYGEVDEARRCIDRARLLAGGVEEHRDDAILGALLRTYADEVHDAAWMPALDARIARLAPADHLGRATLQATVAVGALGAGDFALAERASAAGIRAMEAAGSALGATYCQFHLAQSHFYRGAIEAAEASFRAALVTAEENYGSDRALKAVGNSLLAHILYWRDELDEARRRVDSALDALEAHDSWLDILTVACFTAVFLAAGRGDAAALDTLFDRVKAMARGRGLPQLDALADAWRLETLVARGDVEGAAQIAADRGFDALARGPDQPGEWRIRTAAGLAVAQLHLRTGQAARALQILRPLRATAERQQRALDVARVDTLLACAARLRGETPAMLTSIAAALDYAAAHDVPRVVTGVAVEIDPLLNAALRGGATALPDRSRAYARRLRQALPTRPPPTGESLSGRELAVLGQLCVGRSNKDIGRQLDLSENTVKFHLKRVYEKLGAHSRSAAVSAAIQRGLIRID